MATGKNGALGLAFTITRVLEVVCLTGIIGMTANFISEMVAAEATPPQVLVGTLSVVCPLLESLPRNFQANSHHQTCISVLYCVITYILYLDAILPFLVCMGADGLLLIAVTVVAVTIGKPLSYMDCMVIGSGTGHYKSAYSFAAILGQNLNKGSGEVDYSAWAGATKTICLEMKSIWGLSIALW